jgi:cytidyltransferase-like protein
MIDKYKIGMTAGTFDILNIGHIEILQQAKSLCDHLIVAVNSDELVFKHKKVNPIIPLKERMKIISELKSVDTVVIQNVLVDIKQFQKLNANMFFVGTDYIERNDIEGIRWLKEHRSIHFFPYTEAVSSSIIKNRIILNAHQILNAQKQRVQ